MRRCILARAFVLAAALLGLAYAPTPARSNPLVYSNNFEDTVGTAWSSTERDTTPIGARVFLGRFYGPTRDSVRFTLAGIPMHSQLTLSFKLFVLLTWDGNFSTNPAIGPDRFTVTADGARVLSTTFSNGPTGTNQPPQAFPDSFPSGSHPFMTGASEKYTLGYYRTVSEGIIDAVYNLSITFSHSSPTLTLLLGSTAKQGLGDECWGIDDFLLGLGSTVGVDPAAADAAPALSIHAAPNPTRNLTRFTFTLARAASARVSVYGLDGRMVRELRKGPHAAGKHEVAWDGRDTAGRDVAPGVYFASVATGEGRQAQRVVRLR